jgi:hypothetical protein
MGAQNRNDGVRHRDRATVAGIGLRPREVCRRTGHVSARPRLAPGRAMDAEPHGGRAQFVIRRMKRDLVDAVSIAIERP